MSDNIKAKLDELGLVLPAAVTPLGAYVHYVQSGSLLMIFRSRPG